jgi:hypothetical protein
MRIRTGKMLIHLYIYRVPAICVALPAGRRTQDGDPTMRSPGGVWGKPDRTSAARHSRMMTETGPAPLRVGMHFELRQLLGPLRLVRWCALGLSDGSPKIGM